jgi:PAS domain S-box-containing protein
MRWRRISARFVVPLWGAKIRVKSTSHYRDLVEQSHDLICTHDLKGRLLSVNAAPARLLGYQVEELLRIPMRDVIAPEFREQFDEYLRQVKKDGVAKGLMQVLTRTGERRIWEYHNVVESQGAQGGVVRGIAHDVTERICAERALRESEERLRLAVQAARMYAYDWDPITDVIVRSEDFGDLPSMRGEPARTTRQQLLHKVHPEDRAKFVASVAERTPEDPTCRVCYRMLQRDGSIVWLEKTARAFFDSNGKMLRMIGMVADVSERKLAEDKLREYERAIEGSEEMIAVVDREYRYLIANRKFLNMRNMTKEQVVGHLVCEVLNTGVFETIVKKKVDECFEGKVVRYEMKYTYPELGERDVLISCFPIEGVSGVDRVACIMQDITERKLAEAALVDVNRRLIEAQEQERARIARDLHDDIGQRLALLAVQLEQLQQNPRNLPEIRSLMGQLQEQASEIAADIQSLSHELHSSKLEHLGLAGSLRGLCREFGEQQKVEIDFKAHDLPGPVSPDISLCLFRVLQEALHNSLKHSGVRHFEVRLWGTSSETHLTISDSGAGFDPEAAKTSRGLGLISMEERLKLLKGTLSIESQLKRGTTIHARIPFRSEATPLRAAG